MGKKAEKKKEQRGQQDVAKAAKKADAPPTVEEAPRGDIHIKHERLNKSFYESELVRLQLELVKWQTWIKQKGLKVVMLFEGRDAAGKGGVIKLITEPLNPRGCREVALGTPTEKEKSQWYFQRYVEHLPAAGDIVLFDRSWYNRAGVERVMGFCTDEQYEEVQRSCPEFERMLIRSGIILLKYWFSVSDEEQERRFHDRAKDPGKRWKLSPMDMESISRWVEYSKAKDTMLNFSNIPEAPWFGVEGDDKRRARLNCIHHVLSKVDYKDVLPSVIKVPERPPLPKDYQRPPREEQFHVPEVY